MHIRSAMITLTAMVLALAAGMAHGTILAYDGFTATTAGGGGAYTADTTLSGQGPARTGFTGNWSTSGTAPGTVDYEPRTDGLSYPGTPVGGAGRLELFRVPTSGGSGGKTARRELSYASPGTGDFYLSFLLSYSGNVNEGSVLFEDPTGNNRHLEFELDSSGQLTVDPAGGSATTYSEQLTADQANLIVLRAIDASSVSSFYDTYEIWINPTISGGSLGAADDTGSGILRNFTGGSPFAFDGLSFRGDVLAGAELSLDEVYITNDLDDLIASVNPPTSAIPEPATAALTMLALVGTLLRKPRRHTH